MRAPVAALGAVVLTVSLLVAPSAQAAPAPVQVSRATQKKWDQSFAALRKRLSGPASVSVTGLGRRADEIHVGSTQRMSAWSTIKIPISMAALRRSKSATTKNRVNRALRHSDNGAAAQLWRQLGSGRIAAKRTNSVLRKYGNKATSTQWRTVRAGASPYGQTKWSSVGQSYLMAGIACDREGIYIRRQLNAATSGYWGLRRFDKAYVKNGYGPRKGGALVRQVAIVVGKDGRRWGVSISIRASSTNRGFTDASIVTDWLRKRIRQVPAKKC